MRLEVYSWWQTQSEADAFTAVIRAHRRTHGNVEIVPRGERSSTVTAREMAPRLLAGAPPATFLANSGANLLGWTMFDHQDDPVESVDLDGDVPSSRWIEGLPGLFRDTGLNQRLRPGLRDDLSIEPQTDPYAVPINVHRLNVMYYRPAALADFQSRPGNENKSFLELGTLCPEPPYDPVADELDLDLDIVIGAGGDQVFTIVLLTFEAVLPAVAARNHGSARAAEEFYYALFRGEPIPRDPVTGASEDVEEALRCVQYLSQWFRRVDTLDENDMPTRQLDPAIGWAEAVTAVAEDQSATFTVMGDWANGLLGEKLESGEVIGAPFPGSRDLFVYTSDTFPLPIGTEHRAEVLALLETIATPDTQVAFSKAKGSIPAHRDARLDNLEDWQQATAQAFESPTTRRLLATSGLFPPYYPQGDLGIALRNMVDWELVKPDALPEERERALEEALRFFTDTEPLLGLWQRRLARGAADPRP